jgi:hypothetical protein
MTPNGVRRIGKCDRKALRAACGLSSTSVHKDRPGCFTNRARGDTLLLCWRYHFGRAEKRDESGSFETMRANMTQRDNWAQIRIGACALLLPPLTLGAAFYSMLATPEEGAARPPGAAARTQAVRPELLRDTTQAWAISADAQPVAQASQPIAIAGKPAPPENRGPVSAAGARQQPVGRSADEMARVSDSVPVQVTVVPPAGANPPPSGEMDGAPTGSLAAEPSRSAPAEMSTALLPRVLIPPGKAPPQIPPPGMTTQTAAAQAPSPADPPSAEGPSTARKHTRSDAPAVRRNAQPQQHQNAFSLKNWLQQLGIRPHNTRG